MKKLTFILVIGILVLGINVFGQSKSKKVGFLPEVNDEVLVKFRQKRTKARTTKNKSTSKRKAKPFFDEADAIFGKRQKNSRNKYANQEISYRKKSNLRKKGVTHDAEFEGWANRKNKSRKIRRHKK